MIYTGLRQTPAMVVATAIDEDVDVIGLSMLSGAHMTLAPKVVELLRAEGSEIPVVVGGIIPDLDVPRLLRSRRRPRAAPGCFRRGVTDAVRGAAGATAA
ncbi:MAG: cobalamin-dependent protein [Acidimicrobiales bacterium]